MRGIAPRIPFGTSASGQRQRDPIPFAETRIYGTERQRRQEGIYVEDDTWEEISGLIAQHKLEDVIGQP
jgi:LDH2 family malate/lactate/ureidoglycolate dehydrogenase